MITLVVARDRKGAIGKGGDIPWRAPEDLTLFMRETTGGALIMGRRTWESLPKRPLPRRLNIVVSRDASVWETVAPDVGSAVAAGYADGRTRVYGVGGRRIYEDMLPLAHRILVTEVDLEVDGADAWFPDFDESEWREVRRVTLRDDGPRCMARDLFRRVPPPGAGPEG